MMIRFRTRENYRIQIHENKCLDKQEENDRTNQEHEICDCRTIKNENSMRYLGIQFNKNMKWNNQTIYIKNKLNSILHKMQYIKRIVPLRIKVMIYKTLCESVIRYGLETYGYTTETNLKPIKSAHKKIIKATLYPHTTKNQRMELMRKFQILNFENLHKYIMTISYYYEDIYRQIQDSSYNTRHIHYIMPNIRNNYGASTFEHQIPKLLNELPDELKEIENEKKMKLKIKEFYLSRNNEI